MLYYLLYQLHMKVSAFNVFRYITFRSVGAMVMALLLSLVLGPLFIRWLTRLRFGQQIHADVKAHQAKDAFCIRNRAGLIMYADVVGAMTCHLNDLFDL